MEHNIVELSSGRENPDWRQNANCLGEPGELFFPPTFLKKDERITYERLAKAICGRCAVRQACLEDALSRKDEYGIWGGLNEVERRGLQRVTARLAADNSRRSE